MPGTKKKVAVAVEPGEASEGLDVANAAPKMKWRLTWGEHSWTEDDLTGADLCEIAVLLGSDWRFMTPTVGPLQLVAFLTVFVARETGEKFPKVMGRIKAAKASDLVDTLTLE